jgi:ligand-binding sensor domain-containing protein
MVTKLSIQIFALCIISVFSFNIANGQACTVYSGGDDVTATAIDKHNNAWFGLKNGNVSKFDGTNWTHYSNLYNPQVWNGAITSIAVDAQDNIWFTVHSDGVYKFDGTTWTHFNTANCGIANNEVTCMALDLQGNKWFGHRNNAHVSKFDGINWTTYTNLNPNNQYVSVSSIACDKRGNLWFCALELVKFDGVTWTRQNQAGFRELYDSGIKVVNFDSSDNVWIGTGRGLGKFNGSTWVSYFYTGTPDPQNPNSPNVRYFGAISSIAIDAQNNIWCTSADKVIKFDGVSPIFYPFEYPEYPPSNIFIDAQNNKWVGHNNGNIAKYNNNEWRTFNLNRGLITGETLFCSINSDSLNNKWIGTKVGVSQFDGVNWTNHTKYNSGLPNDDVKSIVIDSKNNKWFLTVGKLTKFNGTTWTNYDLPTTHPITDFIADNKGNIWLVTCCSEQVYKFNDTIWTNYRPLNTSTLNYYVRSLAVDLQGVAWFATYDGVYKLDGTTWTRYTSSISGLYNSRVLKVVVDKQGNKWFKTDGEANLYDPPLCRFDGTSWKRMEVNNNTSGNDLLDIYVDSKGNQWFRTNIGLLKYNGANWLNIKQLSQDCVHWWPSETFIVDKDGDLWQRKFPWGIIKFSETGVRTSVDPIITEQKINLYPNPVEQILTIEVASVSQAIIVNLMGQIVQNLTTNIGKTEINVAHLPTGIYVLKYRNQTVKFVKL